MEEYQPGPDYGKEQKSDTLPPVEPTEKAKETFEKWGVTREQVARLSDEILPSYRYDQVPQKMKKLAESPLYTQKGFDGEENLLIIPNFFHTEGKMGQCVDISSQLVVSPEMQDWLNEVNEGRDDNKKLKLSYTRGLSRDHFNDAASGDAHFWNTLHMDSDPSTITLDASYQEISDQSENQYVEASTYARVTNPEFVSMDSNKIMDIGTFENHESGLMQLKDIGSQAVLGISSDKEHILTLGFAREQNTKELRPFVLRVDKNKLADLHYLDEKGEHMTLGVEGKLTQEQRDEMKDILDTAASFQILPEDQAPEDVTSRDGLGKRQYVKK